MRLDIASRKAKQRETTLRREIEDNGNGSHLRQPEKYQPSGSSLAQCVECCKFKMRIDMVEVADSEYDEFICKECDAARR